MLHVTAMTMRRDAIYPSIVVGPPPAEDVWLGKATERIFLPAIRATLPEIVDYDLPFAGAFHNCCIVSIRKAFPGHARKVMHAIWGLGLLSLTKCVIVVDADVDVHDYAQVTWQVGANVDPGRDVLVSSGPLDQLDHAPAVQTLGGKIGIDATAKWQSEGYPREWPEIARMTDEVRDRGRRALERAGHPARRSHARGWVIGAGAAARSAAPDEQVSRLDGRTVVVLGATGYLGRLLVPALGAAGAHVRATARRHGGADGGPPRGAHAGDGRRLDRARDRSARRGRRLRPVAGDRRRRGDGRRDVHRSARRARPLPERRAPADTAPGAGGAAGGPRDRSGVADVRAAAPARRPAPGAPAPRYADRRLQPLAAGDMVACLVAACDGAEDNVSYALAGPDTLAVREHARARRRAARQEAIATRDAVRRAGRGIARPPPRRHGGALGADRARGAGARHPRRPQRRRSG